MKINKFLFGALFVFFPVLASADLQVSCSGKICGQEFTLNPPLYLQESYSSQYQHVTVGVDRKHKPGCPVQNLSVGIHVNGSRIYRGENDLRNGNYGVSIYGSTQEPSRTSHGVSYLRFQYHTPLAQVLSAGTHFQLPYGGDLECKAGIVRVNAPSGRATGGAGSAGSARD